MPRAEEWPTVMLFLTRWFGVTGSASERDLSRERADIDEIVARVLQMQAQTAARQNRPLGRGTHAKGICARARFEVFDVATGRAPELAARLAKGIFGRPGAYPALVRFANADANIRPDFKPDVRSLSFGVDLTRNDGTPVPDANVNRQDFSMQNATTLPINDSRAFAATMKVLTASNPVAGLWSLPFRDKLRVARTILLAQVQSRQRIRPYQHLRYWSNVPFRHGSTDVVKQSATPFRDNPARPLKRSNPNALGDELIRHLGDDGTMSGFDIGLQFLDTKRMTYWGRRMDADFWIENASVEWNEAEAPFHTVARLTLLPKSHLPDPAGEAAYFDVTGNAAPESAPLGSINRARRYGELASRNARARSVAIETTSSERC